MAGAAPHARQGHSSLVIAPSAACVLREEQQWVVQHMEAPHSLAADQQKELLRQIIHTDVLEQCLAAKFPKSKVRLMFCYLLGQAC